MAVALSTNDKRDSMAVSGDHALKEWARWGHDRGPTWPKANTLWRAAHGGGHGKTKEAEMPQHIAKIDLAVVKLPALMQTVVRCYYIEYETKPKEHARQLQISRTDFFEKLKIAQYLIGAFVE